MSRAQRLLDLIQILRCHRFPVAGSALAHELGISLRTLYRDIDTLKAQGAHIDGEPGVGFILRPGFMLPPLMFSEDEIEALVLGYRWVAAQPDQPLGEAARNALSKIAAILPDDLQRSLDASSLHVSSQYPAAGDAGLPIIRKAIRLEQRLSITYTDEKGNQSRRTIWPIALGFFDRIRVVAAWCETRLDYRHFRTDRIGSLEMTGSRYPRRRSEMLREWQTRECLPRRKPLESC